MADNVSTVAQIYEAFGRGDVGAILEHLDDDVRWEQGTRDTGLAYLKERRGKHEAAQFFADLAANLELTRFEPEALCDGGDVVAVPVLHAGRIVGGGEVPPTQEVHLWRFGADGRVVGFQHVFDLAVHERAAAQRAEVHQGATLRALQDVIDVRRAGGAVEVFELQGPQHSGPPPHAHPWDEVYIGVAGEVEVTVGEDHTVLHAGDVVAVAAGRLHAFRVLTDGARMYVITSGHRASSFFADLDADVGAVAPDPTTLPGVVAVARRHGLTSPLFG
ncbi:MAG: nuclear transport factor 2 family protein [Acidimicrobiia bacterium]